jgi:hypothetical protein
MSARNSILFCSTFSAIKIHYVVKWLLKCSCCIIVILHFMSACHVYMYNVYSLSFMFILLLFDVLGGGNRKQSFCFAMKVMVWFYACYIWALSSVCLFSYNLTSRFLFPQTKLMSLCYLNLSYCYIY